LGEHGGTTSTGERSGGWNDLDRTVYWKEGGGERVKKVADVGFYGLNTFVY
jgi:hypothetical protein